MERDFMGLNTNSKDDSSVVVVKQEEALQHSAGFQWSSSGKVSTLPHFMSMISAHEERPLDFMSDRNAPNGFGTLSAFDAAHRQQSVEIQFLGGIPVTVPPPIIPSSGSVAGTTEPRFNSKGSAAPAQLTMFYAGAVTVFDNISPEKAQAILFLAGSGCTPPNVVQPRFQVQASASKLAAVEGTFVNKALNSLPVSCLSSQISISSNPIGQSSGGCENRNGGKTSESPTSQPSISNSERPVGLSTIMSAAVPQARKASLARFLEKRKERVMSSTPYKKPVESSNPDSNDICFSATSNVSASPPSVGNRS